MQYNIASCDRTIIIIIIIKKVMVVIKVRKQERLSFETRYEHSINVPDSTSLNHCLQTISESTVVLSM